MPSLLFVTPVSPFTCRSGSEQRSAWMLQALSQLGEVDVLHLVASTYTKVEASVQNGYKVVTADAIDVHWSPARFRPKPALSRSIEVALGRGLSGYSLVVGRYCWPVCQLVLPRHMPVLVDLDDWRFRTSAMAPRSALRMLHAVLRSWSHRWAAWQLDRFSAVFYVNPQDGPVLPAGLSKAWLPNIPGSGLRDCPDSTASRQILMVGALWYQPNADGVAWLLSAVWPLVRQAMPSATLLLVGSAQPEVRRSWERHPGVKAPGFVQDLAEAYRESAVVAVPILSGGGTNIKVLEAMAHGRPVVVSDFAAQGFAPHLKEGQHLLVGHSAADFAAKLIAVLQQPSSARPMAERAHAQVSASYSETSFRCTVEDFAQRVMLGQST